MSLNERRSSSGAGWERDVGQDAGTTAAFLGAGYAKAGEFRFLGHQGFPPRWREILQFRTKMFNAPKSRRIGQPGHGLGKLERAAAGHL